MSTALHEPPVKLSDAVPGGLPAALTALGAALDGGREADLWRVPDRELAAATIACGRLVSRTTALLTRLLAEVDARELPARSGACSMTAWTRHELNLTPREARTLVGVATAVRGGMTTTGEAFAAGDVGLSQAAAIGCAVGELPGDVPVEVRERAEAELVGYADRFDAQQLTRLGQHILTVVAPDVGESRDAAALERQEQRGRLRRELFFTPDGHGTTHLRGRLTDEAAAIVRTALDPLAAPLPRTAEGPDPRTAGQRRADALVELCRRAVRGQPVDGRPAGSDSDRSTVPAGSADPAARGASSGPLGPNAAADPDELTRATGPRRPLGQLIVTIPLRTLTEGLGYATLPDGTALSAGAARRLACDADLIPTVLGASSTVLDVGRTQRLFTGARRTALVLRDRGCAFPGCDRPPEWCDGHHIVGFADGGRTEPSKPIRC